MESEHEGENGDISTDYGSSVEESSLVSVSTGCFHVNPATQKGKRLQLLQMLLLPFIPIVALIVQNCMTMNDAINAQREASIIEHQVMLFNASFILRGDAQ